MKRKAIWMRGFAVLMIVAGSCSYEFPEKNLPVETGSLNTENYVNIGGSSSSGFMHGALYLSGQKNSLAAILHRQILEEKGVPLYQALVETETGYNEFTQVGPEMQGRFVYRYPWVSAIGPEIATLEGELPETFTGEVQLINDLGIPFLKSYEVNVPAADAGNAYIDRMNLPAGTSVADQAAASLPGFFTLWLGFDDIYNYASDGAQAQANPDPEMIGKNDLTPEEVFEEELEILLDRLLENSTTCGAIANIPDLIDLPYFFYFPYNFNRLTNQQISAVKADFYNEFNDAVSEHNRIPDGTRRPYIDFADNGINILSPQALVVYDDSLSDAFYPDGITPLPKIRQLKSGEMLLFRITEEDVTEGLGWVTPLSKEYYLGASQINLIQTRINRFNQIIEEQVTARNGRLALVDIRTLFAAAAPASRIDAYGEPESYSPPVVDGIPVMFDLGLNSVISLDGLYPNDRGNAWIANEFIRSINHAFGASIPEININTFVGNTLYLE